MRKVEVRGATERDGSSRVACMQCAWGKKVHGEKCEERDVAGSVSAGWKYTAKSKTAFNGSAQVSSAGRKYTAKSKTALQCTSQ
eukprot:3268894-Rhodomonas_salina.1